MVFWIVVAAVLVVGLGSMVVWDRRRAGQRVTQRDVRVAEAKIESQAGQYGSRTMGPPGPYGP